MKDVLSIEEKIKIIEQSESLASLSAGALPAVQSESYYFVSYSHKDYKEVYKDILSLQQAGISIWYDRGLPPGKDWEEIAEEAICKYACAGVIFYISENSIVSDSIHKEFCFVKNKGKDYLSVNLPLSKGKVSSALEMLRVLQPELSKRSIKYKTVEKMFNERVTYIDYNAPLESKLDKISCLKRSPLIEYELINGTASVRAVNNIEVKEVNIPETVLIDGMEYPVSAVSKCAFANCSRLERVTLPKSVKTIYEQAFFNCESLEVIDLKYVGYINDYAFNNCKRLQSVTLNAFLQLGKGAFINCDLQEINTFAIGCSIENRNNIFNLAFDKSAVALGCKNSYCGGGYKSITPYAFAGSNIKEVEIPENIVNIGESAYSQCGKLESVTVNGAVEVLPEKTFAECKNLKTVNLNYNLKEIGGYCFFGNRSLINVQIPDGVERIGERAFSFCTALQEVSLPKNLKKVESATFYNCSALKNLVLPDSVEYIEKFAFAKCSSLISIEIGKKITEIGAFAFENCSGLKIIYRGTKAQWNKINKKFGWDESFYGYTVACSDGELEDRYSNSSFELE